jgi:EAL domain-containing protein (putative c-di-GMP-specific phosphodiesterase class I)
MARSLDLEVIAEGVENRAAGRFLQQAQMWQAARLSVQPSAAAR